jgi:hypothetical protein
MPEQPVAPRADAERAGPPTAAARESAVAMTLLWIIPAVAFVLVMLQGGTRGS